MVQTKERKREYMKEFMRKKRAKAKAAEIKEQVERGNINYGAKTRRTPFMSFEGYKRHFPNASFPTYLKEKIEFEKTNRVHNVPKISREDSFKIEGCNLWHGSEGKQEAIDAEMREGDRLQAILDEPAHEPRPTERTDWKAEVDKQTEEFKAEQAENQQQLEVEAQQAHELEDKILGRRKPKQESDEEEA